MSAPAQLDRAERSPNLNPVDLPAFIAYLAAGGDLTEPEDMLTDLLCDLLHWALDQGLDFDEGLERARFHVHAERQTNPRPY